MRPALRRLGAVLLPSLLSACQAEAGTPQPTATARTVLLVQPPAGWEAARSGGALRAWVPPAGDPLAGRARLMLTVTRVPALREPFQLALAERAVRLSAGQRFRVLSRYRMQLAASDGLVVEAALDGEPALRLRQYLVGYSERAFVLTGEASAKAYEKAAPLFDAVAATARFGEERTDG